MLLPLSLTGLKLANLLASQTSDFVQTMHCKLLGRPPAFQQSGGNCEGVMVTSWLLQMSVLPPACRW